MEKINLEIVEHYKDKPPPINFKAIVQKLFDYIPAQYQNSLDFVKLEDGTGLSRKQRRESTRSRGKKYVVSECQGAYYEKTRNRPSSIVLYTSNMLQGVPLWVLKVPFFRDFIIAITFYHEYGHHIHKVHYPEHRHPEDVAEKWNRRLRNRFVYRHYWYLLPILLPIALVLVIFKKLSCK